VTLELQDATTVLGDVHYCSKRWLQSVCIKFSLYDLDFDL